jgi:DNA-binding CsgD family transcriptional regulator
MDYVVQGLSAKEIGVALGIAPGTVGGHIRVIRAKLQVLGKNRNALIAAYLATLDT